ncbi:MAG TPA: glycosyltransferase family A protein [Vicinamibacterales bacterium]|nr:glycosyltransferase family A protein [Vicinamibacterales bacterium]
MSAAALRYAAVTPVRDEAANLPRLAAALASQTCRPAAWIIVDTGSTDDTVRIARDLGTTCPWTTVAHLPAQTQLARGAPIVRAFHHGVAALHDLPDIVVKLDADVSFDPDYFERLLANFARDPGLGMASGMAYEMEGGRWQPRFNTANSVWGAVRAYRRECLRDVLPLEEHMGWDGIDELKARARQWATATFDDIPFRHHRPEGGRDGRRRHAWTARGRAAHYMGYRTWYLGLRALYHARRDPAALAMIWGFVLAKVKHDPVCADESVRIRLRREQSLRTLPGRLRDAGGLQGARR